MQRIKLFIGQDVIYIVTSGRVKTPKSILLPTFIKTVTNNTELLTF